MEISIIVPVFDRRNAGWQALESALAQRWPRDRYEVVAVTARDQSETRDADVNSLLARCDTVVRTELDPAIAADAARVGRCPASRRGARPAFRVRARLPLLSAGARLLRPGRLRAGLFATNVATRRQAERSAKEARRYKRVRRRLSRRR